MSINLGHGGSNRALRNFKTILENIQGEYSPADIKQLINSTDVTARKYMNVLKECNAVEAFYANDPNNGNKTIRIKSNGTKVTDELLLSLREYMNKKYIKKYVDNKTNDSGIPQGYEFGKDGVYLMLSKPSAEIQKRIRETEVFDRFNRKSAKVHASGESLSAVMVTANY